MIITLKKVSIYEITIAFALWTAFLKMAFTGLHDALAAISAVVGISLFVRALSGLKAPRAAYALWIIVLISGTLNFLLVGNIHLSVFISILFSYFPIALCIVYEKELNPYFWMLNYLAAGVYLLFKMLTSDGVFLFETFSRNNLSILLMAWLIIYVASLERAKREVPMWALYFYFACCVVAIGRGGILSSGLILALSYLRYHFKNGGISRRGQNVGRAAVGVALILICALVAYFKSEWILEHLFSHFIDRNRFANNDSRLMMIKEYFHAIREAKDVLLGADKNKAPIIAEYSGNPHNSYVFAHMRLGLPGFLLLVAGGIFSAFQLFRTKRYALCIMSLGYFLRIFTDALFPGTLGGDVSFWIIVFSAMKEPEGNRNARLLSACVAGAYAQGIFTASDAQGTIPLRLNGHAGRNGRALSESDLIAKELSHGSQQKPHYSD